MGRPARFDPDLFLHAATRLVADRGPAGTTIAAVASLADAPTGSIYHRFPSRDSLLAEVWLRAAELFQTGLLAAMAGDLVEASLHTPRFAREHLREARVLLLHRREEITASPWRRDARERAARLAAALA